MRRDLRALRSSFAALALLLILGRASSAGIVDFEDLTFAPGQDSWSGPDPSGTTVPGPLGPETVGSFRSGGVSFVNRVDQTYGIYSGFAYSRVDDATHGFPNLLGAITGTGRGGAGNYGVASGYHDLEANLSNPTPFDPTSLNDLRGLPFFTLPTGSAIEGMYVTNTTYAYLSMTQGDQFGLSPFGGANGTDPDYFLLTAYGSDAAGHILSTSVDFYLADYRSANSADDYIVTDWRYMDLSALRGATQIYFNLSGSKVGAYGLNTPGFFAVDDIQFGAVSVPEPSSVVLCATGLGIIGGMIRRRRSRAGTSQGDRS